jgi:hypothetical protein
MGTSLARCVLSMDDAHPKRRMRGQISTTGMLATLALNVLFGAPAFAQNTTGVSLPVSSIIEQMEKAESGHHANVAYQLLREYRLSGTSGSSVDSDVTAEINFRPPMNKDYHIQKASGSKRGEQIVRRLLDREVKASSPESETRSALTRENYDFIYLGETLFDGEACFRLELKPKKKAIDVIAGEALVDKKSFFIRRIEGDIAKTPSWWLKRVHVILLFADFQGAWLQTSMQAVADVRLVGQHTLTSQIVAYRRSEVVASTRIQGAEKGLARGQ